MLLDMINELVVKYELDKDGNNRRKHEVWIKIMTEICKRTKRNYKLAHITKKWENFKAKQKRKMLAGSEPEFQPMIVKNDQEADMEWSIDESYGDE